MLSSNTPLMNSKLKRIYIFLAPLYQIHFRILGFQNGGHLCSITMLQHGCLIGHDLRMSPHISLLSKSQRRLESGFCSSLTYRIQNVFGCVSKGAGETQPTS